LPTIERKKFPSTLNHPAKQMTTLAPPPIPESVNSQSSNSIYNRTFWLCYFANSLLVTGNALTFRFANFVEFLHGNEQTTGIIVGLGLTAALLFRLRLGSDIDHFGTRRIWLGSSILFLIGCLLLVTVQSLDWQIFAARIAFAVGIAGMFTSAIVFIQNQAPPERRTEIIGNLGSSGFIGMIAGSLLADLIMNTVPESHWRYTLLFGACGLLGVCYLGLVMVVTRQAVHRRPRKTPALLKLMTCHWPGPVLLVAVMMGVGMAVTTVFLTKYVKVKGFIGIGPFFFSYAVSAFLFRVMSRNWSRTVGRHRMILLGLCGNAVGYLLLSFVTASWQLTIPAVACGFGHALLFPAVVSLGAGSFPIEFRGLGTTLILGFCELGCAIFAPVLGTIIDHAGFQMMYTIATISAVTVAVIYQLTAARQRDTEQQEPPQLKTATVEPEEQAEPTENPAIKESVVIPFPHIGRNA